MYKSIADIFKIKLSTGCPQVSFVIPIALEVAIDRVQQEETSDIEFPPSIKKWSFDIFLNYIASFVPIDLSVIHYFPNTLEIFADINSTALIRVLSWFDYPKLFAHSLVPLTIEYIRILQPKNTLEPLELFIHDSFLDMESERQFLLPLLLRALVKCFHIIVKCFLIAQVVVILQVVAESVFVLRFLFFHLDRSCLALFGGGKDIFALDVHFSGCESFNGRGGVGS